ncbi:MAG: D-sedoheptulose 7-phosphate isomerase [Geobacteraceae bacterium]|nr:D-sedoheptulose 7-phosphate isomerase [Geobacteraceae bacterium]
MTDEIRKQLQDHRALIELLERDMTPVIAEMAGQISSALASGNKLLVMGNGGSAADSQHFVAEIVGRFKMERTALPAVSLTTDTSILTAIGNDYGFESIFSRQVEALAVAGDVVVGLSTSGNSPNVLKALNTARERGCRTIGLLGRDGGSIKPACDLALVVPSTDTPRIQEGHITIIHIVCDLVEKKLFG